MISSSEALELVKDALAEYERERARGWLVTRVSDRIAPAPLQAKVAGYIVSP
jgi:hypothetical protein